MENEGIAIVGMSGRFPGAGSIEEYWRNLKEGKDCITFFDREDVSEAGVKKEDYTNKNYVCAGGILENIEYFDEGFFGMTPREAADMDPQQRLFLECTYEALEDAGYAKEHYDKPVGVFAGANMSTYFLYHLADKIGVRDDFGLTVGNDKDYIATRTSYIFNLKGPSISVQTACSTSMTAVAMACDSLDSFQCDMAIAGGVAVKLPQKMGYLYQEGMIASPDGYTRPFDESGSGTVFTSVSGAVILKRLEDAIEDGDNIYAVIKGIAVNNDGSDKVGFTAPSREGQGNVIETAQYLAGVDPDEIGYIEAHGTGTKLGDPIELSALTRVFRKSTKKSGYCAIGSVKGNIGHAVSGAGIAGLIKTALIVKYGEIPPSIHFQSPNREIDFINSPFYVNTRLRKWVENDGRPRTAGVSSFGFGGTNVHAVVQEYINDIPDHLARQEKGVYLLTLSARSKKVLDKMRVQLARYLRDHKEISFQDVIYTLHVGRKSFDSRLALVCMDAQEAMEKLFDIDNENVLYGKADKKRVMPELQSSILEAAKSEEKESLLTVARYWVEGGSVNWEDYHSGNRANRISLPCYPFDRKRHWVEQYSTKNLTENRMSSDSTTQSKGDWFYKMNWERVEPVRLSGLESIRKSRWLLLMDRPGLGDALYDYLSGLGADVCRVYQGEGFEERQKDVYSINMHCKEDYQRLIQLLYSVVAPSYHILHLWNIEEGKRGLISPDDLEESIYQSFYSLLFLAQAMSLEAPDKKLKLAVITNHMHLIAGEEVIYPEKALTLGPVKTIVKENPNVFCQSIDLDLTSANDMKKKSVSINIVSEIMAVKPEHLSAYRGPFRWIQISEAVKPEESPGLEYRKEGGTYLITGGMGGLGYEIAKHLAESLRVNLVLTGRSEAGRYTQKSEELKRLGADILYISADCSKEEDMRKVFLSAKEKYGQIHGIFHIAGAIQMEEIVNKTKEMTDRVLAPKVRGTLLLDEWIGKIHPEFVVLFSSIGGILGTAGQIDYNSANSFLDSYAYYQLIKQDSRVISIDWDSWDGVGMLAARSSELDRKVKGNIKIQEGLSMLDKVLNSGMTQAIVSQKNFADMISEIRHFMRGESVVQQAAGSTVQMEDNRPELDTPYIEAANETQKKVIAVWEELLGVHPIGIRDDYFDLGGNSLMATDLVSRLGKVFQQNFALRDFFACSTVEQFADMLEGKE